MPELPPVGIALRYHERAPTAPKRRATFLDLSAALDDFELTYEVAVLRSLPEHADYDFANFFLLGRHRPVPVEKRLQAQALSYESPFHVLGVIPKALARIDFVERLVKAVETVYTSPVRIRVAKKRLQVEEARLDQELIQEEWALDQLRKRVAGQRLQLEQAEIIALPPGSQASGPDS